MRSLQRGASPSDQGRTFACRQRRTKCIQFRYALPWRPKHAAGQPESYETMGSIHRRPGLKEDQGRGRPWKTCPHGNSIAIANLIIMHTHMIPASILSYPKVTISCRSLELALVYGYQKSDVYVFIFHASHRLRVICWYVYVYVYGSACTAQSRESLKFQERLACFWKKKVKKITPP